MQWVLWLCVAAATGTCGTRVSWTMPNEAACNVAKDRARIVVSGTNTNVGTATSVEVDATNGARVIVLCLPQSATQTTSPAK